MFIDNPFYQLNLCYLSTLKEMALREPKSAQFTFGLSASLITTIAKCSFPQLEQIAKKNSLCFKLSGNEQFFYKMLLQPDDDISRLSFIASENTDNEQYHRE